MASVRSYQNGFEVTDLTQELLLVPNTWGLIGELGIFSNDSVAHNTVTVESMSGTLGVIGDKQRGERNNVNKDETRKIYSFTLTHHPLDDYITPQDIADKRKFGADLAETEADVIARKLARIRRNHAITLEAARCHTLVTGQQFAPNGTVSADFYSVFGITRKQIDFTLGTSTTDVMGKIEEGIAHIQDNVLDGSVVSDVVAICSPEFFGKLINHAKVQNAYQFYSSTQEPLRNRLGTGLYRRFQYGGIEFIEYRGSYNGTRLIPAGEAYAVPRGVDDAFVTYFGPANKFDAVNTAGEEAYVWTYRSPKGDKIEIESESNFLNLLRRPATVVKMITSN